MSSADAASEKLMTPANVVTLVRICLVPLFVVAILSPWPEWLGLPQVANNEKSLVAAVIFVLISCTDWLDGYLARSRGEVTNFGKFMDPLADKILVTAALLALIELGTLPSWIVLIILTREFIVSGVRMMAASKGVVIAASWYGKFKTVFQMIAIVLFTVKDSYMVGAVTAPFGDALWLVSWAVMIVALVLTIVSMLDYIVKARNLIGLGPRNADRGQRRREKKAAAGAADAPEAQRAELSPAERASIEPAELAALASAVVEAATAKGVSVATAESLTGGMISAALTAVPGSSAVVRGGVVSYMAEVKEQVLGVAEATIEGDGVVSEQTALSMARGAVEVLDAGLAVAVTGIAGPTGAEPGKPVGTVWMALASKTGERAHRFSFPGNRDEVRLLTVHAALNELLDELKR
ncbi:CDP-diacylglycerol--glycerol-3-phosphate 3-phosphatidyltransferase [Xiamenia xianingshaonis]|uniref:CDP-diacylglycerol--glycerol-3-phosphate 3-phosphatidyltransferase n=1 Tax=Xiamenia xianingshaonis TaxID=2682776 RepID=UPI0021BDE41A|nr:CDP-diacylglycerol--glycerol-3-phosphate 3-phosphatidyltransferase [Xiamenia xianingshaonis]